MTASFNLISGCDGVGLRYHPRISGGDPFLALDFGGVAVLLNLEQWAAVQRLAALDLAALAATGVTTHEVPHA